MSLTPPRAPIRPMRAVKRIMPTEEAEQLILAKWLNFKRLLWTHVPNGGLRDIRTARRLKALGVSAGVPDILIFDRVPMFPLHAAGSPRGVALELKRQGVRRASPEQKQWMANLDGAGWLSRICSGANEAVEWLESLGY